MLLKTRKLILTIKQAALLAACFSFSSLYGQPLSTLEFECSINHNKIQLKSTVTETPSTITILNNGGSKSLIKVNKGLIKLSFNIKHLPITIEISPQENIIKVMDNCSIEQSQSNKK